MIYQTDSSGMDAYVQPETMEEAAQLYSRQFYIPEVPFAYPEFDRLNPIEKAEWTKQLRSGSFAQGKRLLKKEEHNEFIYCCLGLLCEMNKIPSNEHYTSDKVWAFEFEGNEKQRGLPSEHFMQDKGFLDNSASFYYDFTLFGNLFVIRTSLATLNDEGFTFNQIADVIDYFF